MEIEEHEKMNRTMTAWSHEIAVWRAEKGFITTKENMLEKLMLVVTEVAEAAEAVRHGDWVNFEEEMADTIIRCLDITGSLDIDIDNQVAKKMLVNLGRPFRHGKLA